jgi:hypothetical protein
MNSKSLAILLLNRLYYGLPFILLGIWLLGAFETAINYDHLFLLESARRMIDGYAMSEAYFDTNPPWSIILYLPVVFFEQTGLFPAPYTVYTYTLLIVLIFAAIFYRLLRFYPSLIEPQKIVLVFCFLLANTILTASREFYFGERDQFIFIGLLILALYQDLITRRPDGFKIGTAGILTMAVCTFFILLKPHYLLIPGLVGLYRWYKTRRFVTTIFSADALTIATMIILYIATLFFFFPDFIDIILPVSLDVYVSLHLEQANLLTYTYGIFLFVFFILLLICGLPANARKYPAIFFCFSAICLFLYWCQGKGFYYQLFPMIGFYTLGVGLLLYDFIRHHCSRAQVGLPVILSLILALCIFATHGITVPGHNEYVKIPLVQELRHCKARCSFYMFSFNMDIIQQMAYYNEMHHISRFPNLWWYPYLLENPDAEWGNKIFGLYYEDFIKNKPDYLILIEPLTVNGHNVDIHDILTRTPEMQSFMSNYEFLTVSELKASDYLGNVDPALIYEYSIYKKAVN